MKNNLLDLAQEFIKINSNATNLENLNKVLNLALDQFEGMTIERFERNGKPSALVYKQNKRPKIFNLILNGHLDIVPGKEWQYTPQIKGNKLYGVGSMDMKANVACLIEAFKQTINLVDFPIGLQLVTDEEIGGFDGTKFQIEEGVNSKFVICGEPTNFDVVNQAKGILWLKIRSKGITAHGAYPWKGKNAIWKMIEFLQNLQSTFPIPNSEVWKTTLNLSNINSDNLSFNKIPDLCEIALDIRYIPEDLFSIEDKIKDILPDDFEYELIFKDPALQVESSNSYLVKLKQACDSYANNNPIIRGANGSSDARHFAQIGVPAVEFGPIGGGIGSDDEWVDIESLEDYTKILKKFILSLN